MEVCVRHIAIFQSEPERLYLAVVLWISWCFLLEPKFRHRLQIFNTNKKFASLASNRSDALSAHCQKLEEVTGIRLGVLDLWVRSFHLFL